MCAESRPWKVCLNFCAGISIGSCSCGRRLCNGGLLMLGTIAEGTCSEMQVMRAVGCVVGKKFETLTVCHR